MGPAISRHCIIWVSPVCLQITKYDGIKEADGILDIFLNLVGMGSSV